VPSLAEYRHALAPECGPYTGPPQYLLRASNGSNTTKVLMDAYPILSTIGQNDVYVDRPLFRPNAFFPRDHNRVVSSYTPEGGEIVPDGNWSLSPFSMPPETIYQDLEAHTYGDLEFFLYEDLEGGVGEVFEILGPFDAPTLHALINDGLKQTWLIVEVAALPVEGATRHDLGVIAPWLQDPTDVLQVGYLVQGEDRNATNPFSRLVQGQVARDGGVLYLDHSPTSFLGTQTLYLRCLKRAYDHCRPSGGDYGDQAGLVLETDEAAVETEWLVSSALLIAWRRFGHILEAIANQRLIRDQNAAAAWFSDRTREHFSTSKPDRTLRRISRFGPLRR
jgi:hypothetical protein